MTIEEKDKKEEDVNTSESSEDGIKDISSPEEDVIPSDKNENNIPSIEPGMVVRVHQKIKELDTKGNAKERIQVFEGIVIAHHAGQESGATFTVRKVTQKGVAVEKIFPLGLPTITKIEIVRKHKVRRSKLYFLRGKYKKKMKEIKE